MKKKWHILECLLIIILIGIIILLEFKSEDNVALNENTNNKNKIYNSFLTYMIEAESGSGIYEKTTANSWPESGYIFNSTLSGCENGGELKWDDENKQVLMLSVKSDKCYVYFDKYLSPTISSVSVTDTTTSSISVSVSASGGTNNVATYYYSINDGAYTSSSSNTHTFSALDMGTEYIFKVYVEDSMGYKSMIYELNETTDELHYFIVRKVLNGYFSLNGERIAVEVNNPIYYEVGDILTYSHSQACADKGIKIYNENEILVNQLSNRWGYDYEPIVLNGTEKYIEEYEEGRCEPS